jgi:hypothetical protein
VSKKRKEKSSRSASPARTLHGAPQPITEGDAELARKLEELTPEQAEMFVRALHLAMRKRRVLIAGYLATAIAVVLGWLWALYIYGKTSGSGEFMAWVFLIPPALGAILLFMFGRISRRLRD